MPCIDRIYSVSVVVGTSKCNGRCAFCAGRILRPDAAEQDGEVPRNLECALRLCSKYGGWSVSLTGSGEPTLSPHSVTNTLRRMYDLRSEGTVFPFVNLFTNGIEIGKNPKFRELWLPMWKTLGMTAVAVSIHSVDHNKQAAAYGLQPEEYPQLPEIFDAIRSAGLTPRATLLLRRGEVDNAKSFKAAVDKLIDMDIDMITSWPLASPEGERTIYTPSRLGMLSIRYWLWRNTKRVMGHVWGGGVYDYKGRSVRLTDYVSRHKPDNDFIRQLVVFQDGRVAYSWFQKGAFCIK